MDEQHAGGGEPVECAALGALCLGLRDAGVGVVTGYPGFHAHDLVAGCGGTFSVNERTAYAVAWGAAAAGLRSAVAVKNVGLNDAADPFLNSHRLRTPAGFVVLVFDDVEVAGSQCRQDSRPYFDLAPGLWFEPDSAARAYWCARNAPAAGERFGLPVVIRVTNALLRCRGPVVRDFRPNPRGGFRRAPAELVAHPVNARTQEDAADRRQAAVADHVEDLHRGEMPAPTAAVAVRVGPADPRGAGRGNAPEVVLWTYPLPEASLRRVLRAAGSVAVSEQGGPFVREKILAMTGSIPVDGRNDAAAVDHSAGYRTVTTCGSLSEAIRRFPDRVVVGDLGGYTMDPERTVDVCLCYGAGVAVAIGCSLARPERPVFCVVGDGAFIHSGMSCLEEGQRRGARVVAVVLDNGGTASTGGQPVPGIVRVPCGIRARTVRHDSMTADSYQVLLGDLARRPGMSVLHVDFREGRV